MTYAKVIEDSISTDGHRLTTMEIVCHRFVLAEFNTHRAFSRNSASSRAIPVRKQLDRVRNDMAYPLEWPSEQKGMQGGAGIEDIRQAETWWEGAAENAIQAAEALASLGLHKSLVNRLLEPFMWHTIIVTATDWSGFFEQRCSPLAQPEIRAVAEKMREVYADSTPVVLSERAWHLPYVDSEDLDALADLVGVHPDMYKQVIEEAKKVSAARCARVSYLTHDGNRDVQEDISLYERLVLANPPHWSPLEHVATPWSSNVDSNINLHHYVGNDPRYKRVYKSERPRIGNLTGWRSLRTEFESVSE